MCSLMIIIPWQGWAILLWKVILNIIFSLKYFGSTIFVKICNKTFFYKNIPWLLLGSTSQFSFLQTVRKKHNIYKNDGKSYKQRLQVINYLLCPSRHTCTGTLKARSIHKHTCVVYIYCFALMIINSREIIYP